MTATGAANRRRGKDTERKVRDHLRANGFPFCDYTRAGAAQDRGDLSGVIDRDGDWWVVEVKGWRQTQPDGVIEAAAKEAEAEAVHAGAGQWCVIARKPGCSDVGQWAVWMPVAALADVIGAFNDDGEHERGTWRSFAWSGSGATLSRITVRAWLTLVAPYDDDASPVVSAGGAGVAVAETRGAQP